MQVTNPNRRLTELLALRDRIEHEIEEADRKIVEVVQDRLDRGVQLGASVPGTDYYYIVESVVAMEVAHRAVLRQIKMESLIYQGKSYPYGITLPEV
jgi:hypothetical protein